MSAKWTWLAALGVGLLWAYFLLVLFLDQTIFGGHVRFRYLALIIVVGFAGTSWFLRWCYLHRMVSPTCLKDLTVVTIITLFSLIAADVGHSVYLNAVNPPSVESLYQKSHRLTDWQVWPGEVEPRYYYPTERNFRLLKPNVNVSFDRYGGFYYREMMESPTLNKSVLELRPMSFFIDEHGFRETTPLEKAHCFALGDSFTLGTSVRQGKVWVELLERMIGDPIYNLGIEGSSPKQQLMALEYMLRRRPGAFKIRHLLWMIFEGNDLENSYETWRNIAVLDKDNPGSIFRGTIVDTLTSIPLQIKEQSVIHRLIKGGLTVDLPFKATDDADRFVIDGKRLIVPLYRSPQYGYRLFHPSYIKRASRAKSYVIDHPNRPHLDETFRNMAALSNSHQFKVTILIAPSALRLYAQYFENFPAISQEPHFIDYVEKLSSHLGFSVINLYRLLQPYARETLLYWRDDVHWNERGHEVVAGIIANHFPD